MLKSMIEVLVGMIASGKSTWCKRRAKEGWIVLNDDSIVNAVHAGDYTLYRPALKPLYKSIEDHILHTAVAMKKNLVVDRGLDISRTSRERWICLARSLDVPIRCVAFEVFAPEVHAARRAKADARGHDYEYWLAIAKAHANRYHSPELAEGFVEIELSRWQ